MVCAGGMGRSYNGFSILDLFTDEVEAVSEAAEERRQGTSFERHFQTVITTLIAALVMWIGITVTSSATSLATMQEKVVWMERSIDSLASKLEKATEDRYTATDARRDGAMFYRRFDQLEGRINIVENEHAKLIGTDRK